MIWVFLLYLAVGYAGTSLFFNYKKHKEYDVNLKFILIYTLLWPISFKSFWDHYSKYKDQI